MKFQFYCNTKVFKAKTPHTRIINDYRLLTDKKIKFKENYSNLILDIFKKELKDE